ncbi:MAG: hypothetical protein KBT63_06635 [Porticoccaceae bacterium]|nr:hypothetical protein [Porticoccaceae bacterium]
MFRRKRIFSSALFFPYANRFVDNAKKLNKLDIPTITPLNIYCLPHIQRTAVHYLPVEGDTLRALTKEMGDPAPLLKKFAKFIAELHRKGVYFRSIHLGNVVLTENNKFALIDIADLKCYGNPLSRTLKKRNIKHLLRPPEDDWILKPNLTEMLTSYHQDQKNINCRP